MKRLLIPQIKAVGVFVNETPEKIAGLLNKGVIDIAQLHGNEAEEYIGQLRQLTDKPVIQAFRIETAVDIERAEQARQIMYCLTPVQVQAQPSIGRSYEI